MSPTPDYRLYLVTDPGYAGPRGVADVVRTAVRGGVTIVQIREKRLASGAFARHAAELRGILDPLRIPLIVNDRLDIALAAGVAGVHLGQDDLPCRDARRIGGADLLIGISVSGPEEAIRAERDGASYIAVSPVFGTATKPDAAQPVGMEGIRAIRRAVRLPLVAIGGLNVSNAADAVRAGSDGVAVVSAIMAAADPCEAARDLRRAMDAAPEDRLTGR